MRVFRNLHELEGNVGQTLGGSDWITIDQTRIDRFADVTADWQWIHVDPVRAAKGPFGTSVAHGFLTLSLVPALCASAFRVDGTTMGLNYGLNRVRFPSPVPSGSRVRGTCRLVEYAPIENGAQTTIEVAIEREGATKPVCIAELVSRFYC